MILTSVLVLGKFAKNGIAYFLGQGKISAKEPGLCNQMREIKVQLKTFFIVFHLIDSLTFFLRGSFAFSTCFSGVFEKWFDILWVLLWGLVDLFLDA